MNRKLLLVYNTYGGLNQIPYYIDSIRSLMYQGIMDDSDNYKIAVSACCPSQMWEIQVENTFHDLISVNKVYDNVPVSVSFNDTVDKMVSHFGEFSNYLYIDSGINFWDPSGRFDALEALLQVHEQGGYAMTNAMISNDMGFESWNIQLKPDEDFIFPVGQTTNLHAAIFSKEWKDAYKRILPCRFASHCMESVFSQMAAAIHKKNCLTQKVNLFHCHSMDGASSGSRAIDPDRTPMSTTFPIGGLWFKTKKTVDEMHREGYDIGFSIEECAEYWKHNPDAYDENGFAKSPLLKEFYAREVYLSKEDFDYSKMQTQFKPGR